MYLLDTNICSDYLFGRSSNVRDNFENCNPDDIFLCSIVKAELYYGCYYSTEVIKNLFQYRQFFSRFPSLASLAFDDACAEIYGQIVADLRKAGKPVGENDVMIASIAVSNGMIVVTNNIKDYEKIQTYSRIKTLQFINWNELPT